MTTSEPDLRYPLHYPEGWQRTRNRHSSRFGSKSLAQARDELLRELSRLGATNVILSTNVPIRLDGLPYANRAEPSDPGAAVYFKLKGRKITLACDRWKKVVDNIWAIAKHIEALRGQERWGVGSLEQAFRGYEALPMPEKNNSSWWEVLEISKDASPDEIKRAYRNKVKIHHPDLNRSRDQWEKLQAAYQEAEKLCGNIGKR